MTSNQYVPIHVCTRIRPFHVGFVLFLLFHVCNGQNCVSVDPPTLSNLFAVIDRSAGWAPLCPFTITGDKCDIPSGQPYTMKEMFLQLICVNRPGQSYGCKIDCPGSHLEVGSGRVMFLNGFELSGATTGSVIVKPSATLVSKNNRYKGNRALDGGAIRSDPGARVQLQFDEYMNNTAEKSGGALYVEANFATVAGCSFVENIAEKGGAIFLTSFSRRVHVMQSTFASNVANEGASISIASTSTFYSGASNLGCDNMDRTNCNGALVAGTTCQAFVGVCESPTPYPTPAPAPPTPYPTGRPSKSPTVSPTSSPTVSARPSRMPSSAPNASPSSQPSSYPSGSPSKSPSEIPTSSPTLTHSLEPSAVPTQSPTVTSTTGPSSSPSTSPTFVSSSYPTNPLASEGPSPMPSILSSSQPSTHVPDSSTPSVSTLDSILPTYAPTLHSSVHPSFTAMPHPRSPPPTVSLSQDGSVLEDSEAPSWSPSLVDSSSSSSIPTSIATLTPTSPLTSGKAASLSPSASEVHESSSIPTSIPTMAPTSETTPGEEDVSATLPPSEIHWSSIQPSATPSTLLISEEAATSSPTSVTTLTPTSQLTSAKAASLSPSASEVHESSSIPTSIPTVAPTSETTPGEEDVSATLPPSEAHRSSIQPSMRPSSQLSSEEAATFFPSEVEDPSSSIPTSIATLTPTGPLTSEEAVSSSPSASEVHQSSVQPSAKPSSQPTTNDLDVSPTSSPSKRRTNPPSIDLSVESKSPTMISTTNPPVDKTLYPTIPPSEVKISEHDSSTAPSV